MRRTFLNALKYCSRQQSEQFPYKLPSYASNFFKHAELNLLVRTRFSSSHDQATQLHGVYVKIHQLESGATAMKAKTFLDLFEKMITLQRSKGLNVEEFSSRSEAENLLNILKSHLNLFASSQEIISLLSFSKVFYSSSHDLLSNVLSLITGSNLKFTAQQMTEIADLYYHRSNQGELEALNSVLFPQMLEELKQLSSKALDKALQQDLVKLLYSTFLLDVGIKDFIRIAEPSEVLKQIVTASAPIFSERTVQVPSLIVKLLHLVLSLKIEVPAQLQEGLEKALIENMKNLSDTDIVLTSILFSEISKSADPDNFWKSLENVVVNNVRSYPTNYVPHLLHSFTVAEKGSLALFMEFDRVLGVFENELDFEKIPLVLYDFALSEKNREKIFTLFEEKIIDNVLYYTPEDLSKLLWAYAKTACLSEKLMRVLEKALYDNVETLDTPHFAMVLNAVALSKPQSYLFESMVKKLRLLLNEAEVTEEILVGTLTLYFERNELRNLMDDCPGIKNSIIKFLSKADFNALTRFGNLFILHDFNIDHYEKLVDESVKVKFTERGLELKEALREEQRHDIFDFVSDMQSPNLKTMRLELFK